MPDNSLMIIRVSGENIVFRNFRGNPTPILPKGGDRSFCLIIPNRLIRDQLAARGCNIKKLKDKDIEFVKVAVRCTPAENVDYIWTTLDVDQIDNASLEFTFHEYNINGKKGTRIYLRNAKFHVKAFDDLQHTINIRCDGSVTCTSDNTNNREETKMEKMTRAEVNAQLQLGITAFEMNGDVKRDPAISKLICAMKNAMEYIYLGEAPKSETKTVIVKEKVPTLPEIKQVIFNYPATVVIWSDDVKTVVECQKGDNYDMEKGLALCITKRFFGNKSNFNKQIRKYTEDAKNIQTKKKPKEGTFEERKAERMAQAEANKIANGKSRSEKKKILDKTRSSSSVKDITMKGSPRLMNTKKMVVISDEYIIHVKKKMNARGWNITQTAEAAGLNMSCLSRWVSSDSTKRHPKRMKRDTFQKINKALNIRWRIEE